MSKRTGPTALQTRQAIALLQKTARKEKKAIWLDIAERLQVPRRQRPAVNLWKIEKVARLFKEKDLLVPGKVLAHGQLQAKATVIAFEFSAGARKKIADAGGTALTIEEAMQKKIKPNKIVIVK
jgi:large subunit ribosomal protein L18e